MLSISKTAIIFARNFGNTFSKLDTCRKKWRKMNIDKSHETFEKTWFSVDKVKKTQSLTQSF